MVAIVIIANAISAAGHIIDGTIKSDGKLMFDNGGCNLILLVGFLLMLTVFIHKYIKERKGYDFPSASGISANGGKEKLCHR